MGAENEGTKNYVRVTINDDALPPDKKGHLLQNPPTISYNDEIEKIHSLGWENLIVGYRSLRNVDMAYVNVVSTMATLVELISPNNIITNDTILKLCIIRKGLKVFRQKGEDAV